MKLIKIFYSIIFNSLLFVTLGLLSCNSAISNQEIVEDYTAKCFSEDSSYKKTVEDAYQGSLLRPNFQGLDVYTGPGSTDAEKAEYIQSLSATKKVACAYVARLNLTGQSCTEIAYVDDSKKVTYEDRSRKCE